jgi:hypothetical protein
VYKSLFGGFIKNVSKQKGDRKMQEIKLNGWVAEDKDGERYFYSNKPPQPRKGCTGWATCAEDYIVEVPRNIDLGPDWWKSLRQVINNKVQEPRPELKIDDPVLVRCDAKDKWSKRHFAGWNKNGPGIMVFAYGRTSFTHSGEEKDLGSWPFYKLPEAASNDR